jgi:hypothetical protein
MPRITDACYGYLLSSDLRIQRCRSIVVAVANRYVLECKVLAYIPSVGVLILGA